LRIIICVFLVLLLTIPAFAADPKKGTLRMSGDNSWVAYINGEKVGEGADWQAIGLYPFDLIKDSAVIAVYVHDAEPGNTGSGGFLADIVLDNGDYIGTGMEGFEWKASSDAAYMKDDEWIEPDFDDSGWEVPTKYDQFGAGIWGFGAGAMQNNGLKDPDCEAFWIWAGPNDLNDDVFFRYTIGEAFAVEAGGKVSATWGMLKLR
jgi:hypothetical protein